MKILLKSLSIHNFKGIRDLKIELTENTEIRGRNASGKTTIMDSFLWLMFGKDAEDRKDFSIKTLDSNNEPMRHQEHSVIGVLSVDGMDNTFSRIFKEKWVKKRGEEDAEFSGHETIYFVNSVPLSQKEYQDKVEAIIPENLFKQITNPAYFNAMKWGERRAMLFKIAGDVQDSDVINSHSEFADFLNILSGKTFEEYRKELAAKRKMMKDAAVSIPARIDEVHRAMLEEPDAAAIETKIKQLNARSHEIEGELSSLSEKTDRKNKETIATQTRIFEAKSQIGRLQFEDSVKVCAANDESSMKKFNLTAAITRLHEETSVQAENGKYKESRKLTLEAENNCLRNDWVTLNAKQLEFDDDAFICPTCKRAFDVTDIEEKRLSLESNHNSQKANSLKRITDKGQANRLEINRLEKEIADIQLKIEGIKETIKAKSVEYETIKEATSVVAPAVTPENPQIVALQVAITEFERTLAPIKKADNTELYEEKNKITEKLDALKKQSVIKENNDKLKVRVVELNVQLKSLSQQIAQIEKEEFRCEKFVRAKIGLVEDNINAMFSLVRFKMFAQQINGGLDECCTAMVNGVPLEDVNAAGKIQAGLDIIKTFSKHYDIYAPIWIDNRESTSEIPEMDCQIINLYVDPEYKELKIINN